MKQSSIEWLVEQLHNGKELSTVIRKAKEMHKQEIIEAREDGFKKGQESTQKHV